MDILSINELSQLLKGSWIGSGIGIFPTIENFNYREELKFQKDEERSILHYEQRTWLVGVHGEIIRPSHWETGFLRLDDPSKGRLHNVQSAGRSELLRLEIIRYNKEKYELRFSPISIAHDETIISTSRKWWIDQFNFSMQYEMHMATTRTLHPELHLRGRLQKQI